MIYINFLQNISNCFSCKSVEKETCDCIVLEVYVYEIYMFYDFHGTPEQYSNPSDKKFLKYQKEKQFLELEIKKKFPRAKKMIYYPDVRT